MSHCERLFHVLLTFAGVVSKSQGQTYKDTIAIFRDTLRSDDYNVDVRPVRNQSQVLYVGVDFKFLAIVDLDDVSQSFTCNGFVGFTWKDEILVWDPDTYGGKKLIHPQAKDIWRPRVILANTLEKRDIFADDNAPVTVSFNGSTLWFPGSTFPTSCSLNMTKYPFDVQTCYIALLPMGYNTEEVQFVAVRNQVGLDYYIRNGEWDIINSSIIVVNNTNDLDGTTMSSIQIIFQLKRNPTGILINILLPVVFISFLSLTVFLVRVESGEKISFGTTVLMALSVFMTTMSSLLPVSSRQLPNVVLYIFILLIISLLTVITTIVIVFLHHKEEKETHHLRAKAHLRSAVNKVIKVRKAVDVLDNFNRKTNNQVRPITDTTEESEGSHGVEEDHVSQCKLSLQRNRYKMIGKYIDIVSLVVFFTAWLIVTLSFLFEVSL